MKRIIALVLALTCVVGLLAACGTEPATTVGTVGTTVPGTVATNPTTGTTTPAGATVPTEPATEPTEPATEPTVPVEPGFEVISIAEAIAIAEAAGTTPTEQMYYICGKITEIQNATWGNMVIADETGSILIYGLYSADGTVRYDAMETQPAIGDTIVVYGALMSFNNKTPQIKNGWMMDHTVGSTDVPEVPTVDWSSYQTITVAEAIAIAQATGTTQTTEKYYMIATITQITNETYGNMVVEDETGSIIIYGTYDANGTKYGNMTEKPVVGDKVLFYGPLMNYSNTKPEMIDATVIDYVANNEPEVPAVFPEFDTTLTVSELLALPLKADEVTEGRYYVTATITGMTNAAYGAMWIADETGSISVYNSTNADGTVPYAQMEEKPYKGDTVTMYVTVQNFNGTLEIKSAWIISFVSGETTIDETKYTEMSIAEARAAAEGDLVKVDGVVAATLYANGYIPCGVILVDETGSIYVYDVDLAARANAGDKVTVLASKTFWISEKEVAAANKNGYTGCMQLTDAYIKEIEEGNYEFDKSWITESTVKEVMEIPCTNNITASIYKVTALITKDDSYGSWTNYYIDDLDGKTGSYVYTQCNGGDFAWMDQYDGKICTVYLCPINAKSESSGCYWRFVPVAIIDEGFDVSTVDVPKHVVEYVGLPQFVGHYTGDPAMEMLTTAASELLNFSGATLSYTSNNTAVVAFNEVDGKVIMNCLENGTATITVTATYNGQTYSNTVTVTVEFLNIDYVDVQTAINAQVQETVTVKGIVGTSIANKVGFYLIDETGVIAVLTDSDTMASLQIGQEVIITGLRDKFHNGTGTHAGQTCITGATVVVNNYGSHQYSTASFVTDKTLQEIYDLDPSVDYTTTVFVVKVTISKGTGNYATYSLLDGDTKFTLYSGSTAQYDWMADYIGQEVTVHVAACNWNNKTYYRGCVLCIILDDGTVIYNDYNFSK